ncbi:hypothetical protein OAF09_01170 [bacterium]|nr:hypothetical protein [bacterium]
MTRQLPLVALARVSGCVASVSARFVPDCQFKALLCHEVFLVADSKVRRAAKRVSGNFEVIGSLVVPKLCSKAMPFQAVDRVHSDVNYVSMQGI